LISWIRPGLYKFGLYIQCLFIDVMNRFKSRVWFPSCSGKLFWLPCLDIHSEWHKKTLRFKKVANFEGNGVHYKYRDLYFIMILKSFISSTRTTMSKGRGTIMENLGIFWKWSPSMSLALKI
jgi:hypothetical protein